jgi:hypothetical protein
VAGRETGFLSYLRSKNDKVASIKSYSFKGCKSALQFPSFFKVLILLNS